MKRCCTCAKVRPTFPSGYSRPLPETEALCERVYLNKRSLMLVAGSERHLWRCSVAISVGTWTGSGAWPLKLAPFLIPPFRVLILNSNGGFFSGTPANVSFTAPALDRMPFKGHGDERGK